MILRGLWRLAIGDKGGMAEFGPTTDDFYASLAPLIALPLAESLMMTALGEWRMALLGFLALLDGTLLVPVLVYEFACHYKCRDYWLRTATALNWSFWMLLPAAFAATLMSALAENIGLTSAISTTAILGFAGVYMLVYRWFVLRSGLGVTGARAVIILLACGVGSMVLDAIMIHTGLNPEVLAAG